MSDESEQSFSHQPVMPEEVLSAWFSSGDGIYIDGTFGRGGHSKLLLERLGAEGMLLAFDRDLEAVESAKALSSSWPQLKVYHAEFARMAREVEEAGLAGKVSGILLDLGVSSPQLDDPGRGFSFMRDGALDMRMDVTRGQTAAEWLAVVTERELALVLSRLGEEKLASRIARAIVSYRGQNKIETTGQLAAVIDAAVPARIKAKLKTHAATKSFQAIRLYVNRELDQLESFLSGSLAMLKPGGRLVIISFHSLEDRMVKRFIRSGVRGKEALKAIPLRESDMGRTLRSVGKAIKAGEAELLSNPRARSAVLRVAEKI